MPAKRLLICALYILLPLTLVLAAGCSKPDTDSDTPAPTSTPTPSKSASTAPATSSTIEAKGSDTLLQVAQSLAEAYKTVEPSVDISVTGGGSGTGFSALIDGTADIADASRAIKDSEVEAAEAKGITPVENIIGYDGIAVVVNTGNPISNLTVEQISDIYVGDITEWDDLGGSGEIVVLSRDSTSGTFEYFKEHVVMLGDGDSPREYGPATSMLPSNPAILEQVARTEGAIGYIGLGYLDDSVKALAIGAGDTPVEPSVATVLDGSYPISRPLFMYVPKDASEVVKGYLGWIMSDVGQDIVAGEGFVPVP